jgi:hypothetical protein
MTEVSKIAYLLERMTQGVAAHDRENPNHHTWGIGMAHFDVERLGLEDGEEILPGIVLQADGGMSGQFRILCDGSHDEEISEEEELVDAIAVQELAEQELAEPIYAPGHAPLPPPLQPPL